MTVNFKKSCFLRIGPRSESQCDNIRSLTGSMLPWVDNMRYLDTWYVL